MGDLNMSSLLNQMLNASQAVLKDKWPQMKGYAEMESKKMLETVAEIQRMKIAGQITEEQARLLMDMQKHAMRAVMLATEIMGLAAAEQAINAAIGAVRDTINKAVGFILL